MPSEKWDFFGQFVFVAEIFSFCVKFFFPLNCFNFSFSNYWDHYWEDLNKNTENVALLWASWKANMSNLQLSIFCGHSLTQICSTFFCAENYFMIFYNYLPLHNFVIVHYMTFFFYVFQEAWWFVLIMKIDMNDFVAFHFIFSENSNGINLMNKSILKLL